MKVSTLFFVLLCVGVAICTQAITGYDYTSIDCTGSPDQLTFYSGECLAVSGSGLKVTANGKTNAQICLWDVSDTCSGAPHTCQAVQNGVCYPGEGNTGSNKYVWTAAASHSIVSVVGVLSLVIVALI